MVIAMSEETGKWLPYNTDGSSHDCKTNGQKQKLEPKQEPNQELTVQDFIKRLAEAGITIDLKSIMNTKKEKDK
jgi:hypothetical protein